MTAGIEVVLWIALFQATQSQQFAGFSRESYLSYALWSGFMARVSSNWMYEFRMIFDIESGGINTILTRPMSFFEYYLSQFLGYKGITTVISFIFPTLLSFYLDLPCQLERFPLALLLIFYYLILLFIFSFIIANLAFKLTRVGSLTIAKNFILMILSGELFPLDMLPSQLKKFMLYLPFVNGTFAPTAFLIGRTDVNQISIGFVSITIGILCLAPLAIYSWKKGLTNYVGTGA